MARIRPPVAVHLESTAECKSRVLSQLLCSRDHLCALCCGPSINGHLADMPSPSYPWITPTLSIGDTLLPSSLHANKVCGAVTRRDEPLSKATPQPLSSTSCSLRPLRGRHDSHLRGSPQSSHALRASSEPDVRGSFPTLPTVASIGVFGGVAAQRHVGTLGIPPPAA